MLENGIAIDCQCGHGGLKCLFFVMPKRYKYIYKGVSWDEQLQF